jgi:hypothetical protein
MKMMTRTRILLGFLLFGLLMGFLTALWSQLSDNIFLPNFPAVLYGDAVYEYSIILFGNPNFSQAHYTIPWLLRVPQVYVPVSMLFWGLCGLVIQLASSAQLIKRAVKQ